MRRKGRHKANKRQCSSRLHTQTAAPPESQGNICAICLRPPIVIKPQNKKEPEKGKDCQVKSIYLQSFDNYPMKIFPAKS